MEEIIHVPEEQSETGNLTEYTESVVECFDSVPEVAKPLIGSAGSCSTVLRRCFILLRRLSVLSRL